MKLFLIVTSILTLAISPIALSQNKCELCCKYPCTCFDREVEGLKKNHPKFVGFLKVMLRKNNFLFVEHLLVEIINNPTLIDDVEKEMYDETGACKSIMIFIKQVSGYQGNVCW